MSILRTCIRRRSLPSVWIVQMRSTLCQGPSWQNISRAGSVGENWTWLSQSPLPWWIVFTSPVFTSIVYSAIGSRCAQRASSRDSCGGGWASGLEVEGASEAGRPAPPPST